LASATIAAAKAVLKSLFRTFLIRQLLGDDHASRAGKLYQAPSPAVLDQPDAECIEHASNPAAAEGIAGSSADVPHRQVGIQHAAA
jgi:hypothetical protein